MASEAGTNVQQRRAWDGPDGDNWTDNEDWYNAAARYLTPALLSAAAIAPTEHVLDIGCGTGETTRLAAVAAPAGSAFGIDLSSRMIERAQQRAGDEGIRNVRFVRGDAQVYRFTPASLDVAISRYGSMFFDDPVAAFTNVAAALRPGGRVVMLCWRELARNEWVLQIRAALAAGRDLPEPPSHVPSPFAFADPDRVRAILGGAGLTDVGLDPISEPMYFGPDAASAFEVMTTGVGNVTGLLADLEDESRREALERFRDALEKHETREGVLFGSSAWMIRAAKAQEGEGS